MHVSTLVRRSGALLVVLAAASACSDAPSAPRPAERAPFDVAALQPLDAKGGAGPKLDGPKADPKGGPKADKGNDENTLTFNIDPRVSRTYAFGENWIYFPEHSICDPATSSYGIGTWDTPCTPLDRPIKVTVRWSSQGGYSFAEFSPELRFVPADARNVARWVVLSLHAHKKLHDVDAYRILYEAAPKAWVDEALTDPTLHAWLDPLHNSVYRRVKHFSGYMLASGLSDGGMGGGFSDASY